VLAYTYNTCHVIDLIAKAQELLSLSAPHCSALAPSDPCKVLSVFTNHRARHGTRQAYLLRVTDSFIACTVKGATPPRRGACIAALSLQCRAPAFALATTDSWASDRCRYDTPLCRCQQATASTELAQTYGTGVQVSACTKRERKIEKQRLRARKLAIWAWGCV